MKSRPVPFLSRNSGRPFVPPGVDAQSWLGFEQRIQQRRFQALVVAAQRAISVGDGDAARAALREARELRPRTAELDALEQQLGARVARRPAERPLWRRASGAVALMAVGTGLLIAVDGPRMPVIIPDVPEAPVLVSALGDSTVVSAGRGTTGPDKEIRDLIVAAPPDTVRLVSAASAGSRWLAGEVPDDYVAPTRPRAGSSVTVPASSPAPAAIGLSPAPPRNDWPLANAETVFAAPAPRGPSSVLPPVAYPPAAPAAASAAPAAATAGPASSGESSSGEEGRVAAALNQYAHAYSRLDASAARAVWPSVDERALSNAFAGLASQALDFDDCSIDVRGSAAHAVCRGTARYVPRVGSDRPRIEPRTWRFDLRRDGDAWTIADAVAQR